MEKICEKCLEKKSEKEFVTWERGICDKCMLQEIYKNNVIQLAEDHKINCNHSNCNVSLILLLEMAQRTGIKFTEDEMGIFI